MQGKHKLARRARRPRFGRAVIERIEPRQLLSTIIVNTLADETISNSTTSLREAIGLSASGDTIQFHDSLVGQVNLDGGGELQITKDLTINAPKNPIALSGLNSHRVLYVADTAANVEISGLTIRDGIAEYGGGIYNDAGFYWQTTGETGLVLNNVVIMGNAASASTYGNAGGGGIYSFGSLKLNSCTISNNKSVLSREARRPAEGGGIYSMNRLELNDCIITANTAHADGNDAHGGGIYISGPTALTRCKVSHNSADVVAPGQPTSGKALGGGIYAVNDVTLTLTDSEVSSNVAYESGGGIYALGGAATLSRCAVSNNTSGVGVGGISIGKDQTEYGSLVMSDTTFSGNYSIEDVPALHTTGALTAVRCGFTQNTTPLGDYPILLSGSSEISDSAINNNSARGSGGLGNQGNLTLTHVKFLENHSYKGVGAISNAGSIDARLCTFASNSSSGFGGDGAIASSGQLTLVNCTFVANSGSSPTGFSAAGAVDNGGVAKIIGCTFTGNRVSFGSSAIRNYGQLQAISCTISGNRSGPSDYGTSTTVENQGQASLANCIIADNEGRDVKGTFNSLGFNLIGVADGSSGWTGSDLTGTSAAPIDPKLASLADGDGGVQTMEPLPGSPVIDRGKAFNLATDQRLHPRTFDYLNIPNAPGGDGTDIGAVELQSLPFRTTVIDPQGQTTLQLEDFDSGSDGVAYHDSEAQNLGGAYRPNEAVDLQYTNEGFGRVNVGWARAGEWLAYTIDVTASGVRTLEFHVASNGTGGAFHLECDGTDVTGPLFIPNTYGWQNWTSLSAGSVHLAEGRHLLRLVMDQNGPTGAVGNFDRVQFSFVGEGQTPYWDPTLVIPGVGVLLEAENFDKGIEGVAFHDVDPANHGGSYRPASGVDIQSIVGVGGFNVGWTKPGEWLEYTVQAAASGSYILSLGVASNGPGGQFHVEVDGVDVTGALGIPNTWGWQNWTTIQASPITIAAGKHVIRLAMDAAGATGAVGNFDWLYLRPPPLVHQHPFYGVPTVVGTAPVTIEAENFDYGEGFGFIDSDPANLGGEYRNLPVDIQSTLDTGGGYNVGWTRAGEMLAYSVMVTPGLYHVAVRVASQGLGGLFHLSLDDTDVTGLLSVPNTNGWQKWITIGKGNISLAGGLHSLRLVMDAIGPSGAVGNFNWIMISPA